MEGSEKMNKAIEKALIANKDVLLKIGAGALKAGIGYYLVKKGTGDFKSGAKGIGSVVEAVIAATKESMENA